MQSQALRAHAPADRRLPIVVPSCPRSSCALRPGYSAIVVLVLLCPVVGCFAPSTELRIESSTGDASDGSTSQAGLTSEDNIATTMEEPPTTTRTSSSDETTSRPGASTEISTTGMESSGASSSSTGVELPDCGTGRFPTNAVPYVGFDVVGTWGSIASVALGDLNDDQQPDLVISDLTEQNVRTLLGQASGAFGTAGTLDGHYAPALAIGSIADTLPDLVSFTRPNASMTGSVVRRWRGQGNGNFGPAADFVMDPSGENIALADLNGDDRLDAITSASTSLQVHLGNAAEGFDTPIRHPSPWAYELSTADLDADGFIDVLVPTLDGGFVWWGTGSGGLDGPTALGTLASRASAIGDFNGDLVLDVATSTDAVVEVYAGDGQRGFVPMQQLTALSPIVSMAGADLDDDRCDDIVVAGGTTTLPSMGSLAVLMSLGDDAFEDAQFFAIEGERGLDLALDDLDGDGIEDIVVGTSGSGEGRILALYSNG